MFRICGARLIMRLFCRCKLKCFVIVVVVLCCSFFFGGGGGGGGQGGFSESAQVMHISFLLM